MQCGTAAGPFFLFACPGLVAAIAVRHFTRIAMAWLERSALCSPCGWCESCGPVLEKQVTPTILHAGCPGMATS